MNKFSKHSKNLNYLHATLAMRTDANLPSLFLANLLMTSSCAPLAQEFHRVASAPFAPSRGWTEKAGRNAGCARMPEAGYAGRIGEGVPRHALSFPCARLHACSPSSRMSPFLVHTSTSEDTVDVRMVEQV